MRHGRRDYERFQDPASEASRPWHELIGRLAHLVETYVTKGEVFGSDFMTLSMDAFSEETAIGDPVKIASARVFAARAALPVGSAPIGEDEPVFLLRARDPAAALAVRDYASHAFQLGAHAIGRGALDLAAAMRQWQEVNGRKRPDLPREAGAEGR